MLTKICYILDHTIVVEVEIPSEHTTFMKQKMKPLIFLRLMWLTQNQGRRKKRRFFFE
jgi:hypothetical protein